jgi:hypothetical protein
MMIKGWILWVGLGLVASAPTFAQGTLYLSNLDQPLSGYFVGLGKQSFRTGFASNGYILDSITLAMGNWLGDATNFRVALYSDNEGQPGFLLAALSGSDHPATAGEYHYQASGVILSPETQYWIRTSQENTAPLGGYAWQSTVFPHFTSTDGWSTVGDGNSVDNGFGWMLQFGVTATPVPEPAGVSLVGTAAIVLLLGRKRSFPK